MLIASGFPVSIVILFEVIAGLLLINAEGENLLAKFGDAINLENEAGEFDIFWLFAFFPLNSCSDFFENGFLSSKNIRI